MAGENKKRFVTTGRPKIYKTAAALGNAVNDYFETISVRKQLMDGDEPARNERGNTLTYTKYLLPPSVQDLCLHLGITPRTWENYCKDPIFESITERTKLLLEGYLVRELSSRELLGAKVEGIKFNLTHNYNWKERREVDVGENTRDAMAKTLTLAEKQAMLSEALNKFGGVIGDADK